MPTFCQIMRMCWSLCFSAILESTQPGKVKSSRVKTENTQDLEAQTGEQDTCKVENHRMSFERYWSSNPWIALAFQDAKKFAEKKCPRNVTSLVSGSSNEEKVPGLRDAFKEILLPVLKDRGWKENTSSPNSKKRAFYSAPDGVEVRDHDNLKGFPMKRIFSPGSCLSIIHLQKFLIIFHQFIRSWKNLLIVS